MLYDILLKASFFNKMADVKFESHICFNTSAISHQNSRPCSTFPSKSEELPMKLTKHPTAILSVDIKILPRPRHTVS